MQASTKPRFGGVFVEREIEILTAEIRSDP